MAVCAAVYQHAAERQPLQRSSTRTVIFSRALFFLIIRGIGPTFGYVECFGDKGTLSEVAGLVVKPCGVRIAPTRWNDYWETRSNALAS